MKKQILLTSCIALALAASSHQNATAQSTANAQYTAGNPVGFTLGIGKIQSAIGITSYLGFNATRTGDYGGYNIGGDIYNNGSTILFGEASGGLTFVTIPNANPGTPRSIADGDIRNYTSMSIRATGQVVIGRQPIPTTQSDFKLAVDGKLVSKSIYVTSQSWADFVFEPSYKRMPLPELETYLKVNKHLPHIPSAKEVEAEGYNMGQMDAKLLQSLEELTLHVIEQEKRLKAQDAEIKALKAQMATK